MATMRHHVKAGDWTTVYEIGGSTAIRYGVFTRPAGTEIRLRYGRGWFSRNRQRQSLDGTNPKNPPTRRHYQLRARTVSGVPFDTDIVWEFLVDGPHPHWQSFEKLRCQYCCVCLMTGYRSVNSATSSIAAMTASGLVWWTMWPLPAMGRKMLWLMAL
jgi:hypothetical protein